jgi:hypothetical protein
LGKRSVLEEQQMRRIAIHEDTIRIADEDSVRRLARFCAVDGWQSKSKIQLIDELARKGVVQTRHRVGCY